VKKVEHLAGQGLHVLALRRGQRSRFAVHDTEGADRMVVVSDERDAGVEADEGFAGHHRVIGESRIFVGVRDFHERLFGDGVPAERPFAGHFRNSQSLMRLQPLTVGVEKGHRRHRCAADECGQTCHIVEHRFGGRTDYRE
jgi:hypothetical protein